jgi:uncharacterized protein YqhQ
MVDSNEKQIIRFFFTELFIYGFNQDGAILNIYPLIVWLLVLIPFILGFSYRALTKFW